MDGPTQRPVQGRPKQARSRARRIALIEHGARVLNTQDLDDISIADLTGTLGFSTGSFYSYFRDKEDFFVAVQDWVNDAQDEAFAATIGDGRMHGLPLDDRLRVCVRFASSYFRTWTGVIRAALRYERRIPDGWAPNRARTRDIIAEATGGLDDAARARLDTALQLAFGLLVNALLHDPGPLRLDDPGLEDAILAALTPYLNDIKHT